MTSRRDFFKLTGAVAAASVSATSINSVAMAALPEIVSMDKPDTQSPLIPPNGRPYNPVVTLNGWTLPWRMKDG
ncbi:MAG: copper oxidase, partial [Thiobacillus sp.]|nr:copper oxidase [Thiobacillus sp.]